MGWGWGYVAVGQRGRGEVLRVSDTENGAWEGEKGEYAQVEPLLHFEPSSPFPPRKSFSFFRPAKKWGKYTICYVRES